MKSVTYIITKYPGAIANETIDMVLVSGVMELPTTVLFLHDGIYQLLAGDSKNRDTASKWSTVQTCDVEHVFADQQSLQERKVDLDNIPPYVRVINRAEIRQLMRDSDFIVND